MAINQLLKRMSDFYPPLQSGDLLFFAKCLFVAAMVAAGGHKTDELASVVTQRQGARVDPRQATERAAGALNRAGRPFCASGSCLN